jgi:hypothetical protein
MKPLLNTLCVIILLLGCKESKTKLSWYQKIINEKGLDKKFQFTEHLKPSTLEADFNGDGSNGIAIGITEKSTNRKGIIIIHSKTNDYFVLGAGTDFGNGGNDFNWIDKWSVYTDKIASETEIDEESGDILGSRDVTLTNPAILALKYEDGAPWSGGVIYYKDKKYNWVHQGE